MGLTQTVILLAIALAHGMYTAGSIILASIIT